MNNFERKISKIEYRQNGASVAIRELDIPLVFHDACICANEDKRYLIDNAPPFWGKAQKSVTVLFTNALMY